jgi:hypothetical protein
MSSGIARFFSWMVRQVADFGSLSLFHVHFKDCFHHNPQRKQMTGNGIFVNQSCGSRKSRQAYSSFPRPRECHIQTVSGQEEVIELSFATSLRQRFSRKITQAALAEFQTSLAALASISIAASISTSLLNRPMPNRMLERACAMSKPRDLST